MTSRDGMPHARVSWWSVYDDLLETLYDYYLDLAASVGRFVAGLAVWDRLSDPQRAQFSQALQIVPTLARARYEEFFRRLAVDSRK